MPTRVITKATALFSLDHAKKHLRVDHSRDDDQITRMVIAAAERFEGKANRAFGQKTVAFSFPYFLPTLKIGMGTLDSVNSVSYYDSDGVLQTVIASDYIVDVSDDAGGQVHFKSSFSRPSTFSTIPNPVEVEAVVGHAAEDIPADVIWAVKVILGHMYENREEVIVGSSAIVLPNSVDEVAAANWIPGFV